MTKNKKIDVERIDNKLELFALDDEIPEHQVFLKCGWKDCKEKTVMQLKLPETIRGLRIEGLYPVCRKHLEELYKQGMFDEIKDVNHLKMIEGIIKYGTMEKWIDKIGGKK